MTQTEIAIQMAAECAAEAFFMDDTFDGAPIPTARMAWDFLEECVWFDNDRPMHLPGSMPNGFVSLWTAEVKKYGKVAA